MISILILLKQNSMRLLFIILELIAERLNWSFAATRTIALFPKYLNIDLSIDNYTHISKSIVTSFTYGKT